MCAGDEMIATSTSTVGSIGADTLACTAGCDVYVTDKHGRLQPCLPCRLRAAHQLLLLLRCILTSHLALQVD